MIFNYIFYACCNKCKINCLIPSNTVYNLAKIKLQITSTPFIYVRLKRISLTTSSYPNLSLYLKRYSEWQLLPHQTEKLRISSARTPQSFMNPKPEGGK